MVETGAARLRRVQGGCAGAVCGMAPCGGARLWPTHRDEREGAARVDRDAVRDIEHGAAAGAVAEASRAVAGERGGLPGGDFDTADAVAIVLRCIMGGHAEEELNRRSGRAVCGGNRCGTPTPCARRVCWCRLRDGAMRGVRLWPTHRDKREGAARVDRDADWVIEPGIAVVAVAEALRAAGERGDRPGDNVERRELPPLVVVRHGLGQCTLAHGVVEH